MNYRVKTFSRVGMRSEIQQHRHCEGVKLFVGLYDALDYIRSVAAGAGWRDFELEKIGDSLAVPLRGDVA